jgi:hypothetical protein
MYQRRDYRDDEQITVGFKAFGKLATAVHEAAERGGYPSTTQWLRALARDAAAESLGVTPDSLEPTRKRIASVRSAPSPEESAAVARLRAAQLDADAAAKRLSDALREAQGVHVAPQAPRAPSRRR